jgi:glutamate decarboxylase
MDGDRRHLDGGQASRLCDENTIGVVAVLGSTFDGSYEPVEGISAALDAFQRERGLDLPLHVDAASGGFVAPFLQPDLRWDFRLPRVQSINASGHKYGLVYPGIGWALWRDAAALPEDLVFRVNYLGGDMPTFTLNFSRPGNQIIGQYYNFVRLGREGYTAIMSNLRDTALRLSRGLTGLGVFDVISDGSAIPVVSFRLVEGTGFTVFHLSDHLRRSGWQVPAYSMPADATDVAVLRIVVREGFGPDLADELLKAIGAGIEHLRQFPPENVAESGFSHT